jgi:hypothetical protein
MNSGVPGVLAHIGDPAEDDDRVAQSIVGALRAARPPGGYLAIFDSSDVDPGLNDALHKYNESDAAFSRVRSQDQIRRYFDGLELIDPGVVPILYWRPDHTPFGPPNDLANLGGGARKMLWRFPPRMIMACLRARLARPVGFSATSRRGRRPSGFCSARG